MEQLVLCVANQHDHLLLAVVAVFCGLGAYTSASLLERAFCLPDGDRLAKHVFAGVAFGSTVWTTHFLAMLAYRPGLPIGYGFGLTALSAAVAVAFAAGGFVLARRGYGVLALVGGAVAGFGVAAMHYTGMAAIEAQARLDFSVPWVIVSVLATLTLSAPVPVLAAGGVGLGHRLLVAATLALAVLVLHFTGMTAVVFVPDPLMPAPSAPQPRWLAVAVAAVATGVLALCFGSSLIEQNLALRAAKGRRVRELADAALEGLVIHDRGRVLAANRAFAALLGRVEAELPGAELATLLPPCVLLAGPSPTMVTFEGSSGPVLVEVVARPFTYEGEPATVLALRDLSA